MPGCSEHSQAVTEAEPVVGGIFNGSTITKVDVEISDRGTRLKKRFLLTLEDGIVAIDDRYISKQDALLLDNNNHNNTDDELEEASSTTSFHSFTFEGMELPESAKGAKAFQDQEEWEHQQREERRRRRKEKEENKKKKRNGSIKEKATGKAKAKSDDTIIIENTTCSTAATSKSSTHSSTHSSSICNAKKKVAVVSKITKVVPESDPLSAFDDGPRATWKFADNTEIPEDADLWAAVDICLLSLGKDDLNCYDQDKKSKELTGLWGYAPRLGNKHSSGCVDDSTSSMQSSFSSLPPSSFRTSKDVWVYPPHSKPPSDFPVHGTYKFAPQKADGKKKTTKFKWPPPVDPIKQQQRRVNKLKELPQIFSQSNASPMSIQAFPSSRQDPEDPACDSDSRQTVIPNDHTVSKVGSPNENNVIGVWTYLDGQEHNDVDWAALDVRLFPPGQEPNDENDSDLPQGMWVIYEDENDRTKSGSDHVLKPHDPGNQWIDPQHKKKVHLFPPGQEPNIEKEPVIATGKWTYAKDSIKRKWPPPTKQEDKELRRVGKVNIPKLFELDQKSRPLTVYSKECSENPKRSRATKRPRPDKLSEDNKHMPVHGQWAFFDGNDDDADGNWEPVNIVIYAPDQKPPANVSHRGVVHGIWSIHDADPENICVHPPGFELNEADESVLASGIWTFYNDDEGNGEDTFLLTSWPPPTKDAAARREIDGQAKESQSKWVPPDMGPNDKWKSYKVQVVPESSLPIANSINEDSPLVGIWKFHDSPPDEAAEWVPQDLIIYPEGRKCAKEKEDGRPTGVWGIHAGSEPGEDGLWKPNAIWFFVPGEEENIPEDCVIQGTWAYPPKKKKIDWPPKKKKKDKKKAPEPGKLPKWDPNTQGVDWIPQKVSVVPKKSSNKSKAPTTECTSNGTPHGTWMFSDGEEPDNLGEWNALEILLYPKGVEPDGVDETNGRPTGVWGYHKNATPDEDGEWSANDLIFCAPGVDPTDEMVVQGKWAFFDDDVEWPPFEPFEAKEILPVNEQLSPKMVAKKPVLVSDRALLSPMDRAKLRIQPVKSPEKIPLDDDERHVAILGKYQSAFDVANRPKKPQSSRLLIKKKYKK